MKRLLLLLVATSAFGQPAITSLYPASGPTSGGTFVHILGPDFIGLPLLCPALPCANYVQFGDVLGTISANTSREIVALSPAHAAGTVDVVVNVAGKAKITLPLAFRYENPDPIGDERVMLPIIASKAPGAFGSIWQTETSLSNHSDTEVPIRYGYCEPGGPIGIVFCFSGSVPPHTTTFFADSNQTGEFLLIPRGRIDDLDIKLRVQDVSRQSQTWGTEIPVVRDTDFRNVVRLHNIPTDSRFRSTLRAYNYYFEFNDLRLRIFDETSGVLLVETLSPYSYLQINSLADSYSQIRGHDRVRVEVESAATPPKPVWAFVSVTNNETQHVTVISP